MSSRPLRTADDLAHAGLIPASARADVARVAARYAVAVTPGVAALIARGAANDPIAKQFIPDIRELTSLPEESADPIGDHAHSPVKGVVHRYPDRALLKIVHACPVYCRFCFRREMVGPDGDGALNAAELAAALAYIAARPDTFEVILTGGDPFMLSPRRAKELTDALAAIPHVQIIRWHTRVPFVDPKRVTVQFVDAIRSSEKAVFVGVHANHPREFTEDAKAALARLANAGISLVSQSVLLAGVNDDAETLGGLMRAFLANRVKPYYLHHPDLAPGTSHFRIAIERGQELMHALRGRLSGLAQPTYVIDIPGGHGKSPIGPNYLAQDGASVSDYRGAAHAYPPVQR
ncbi:lysine-2,3-aminomutase-like protein [Terrarubrum flagellatum]|uniref:lysine-2,3-aminomutase-like protein n=1 Tax=Terrirubrum flagellatum TaxID=2895980 RepID=UPI0031452CBE